MPAAKIRSVRYIIRMVFRRTSHAVYDTLYRLVWSPKYRRDVLQGENKRPRSKLRGRLFSEVLEQFI